MSSTSTSSTNSPTNSPSTQPISIDSKTNTHTPPNRRRSASVWSNPGLSPSASPVSSTMSLPTPTASLASSFTNKGGQGSPTSPTSPLSYFLGSPTAIKSGFAGAYGGIGGGIGPQKNIPEGSAVSEEDDTPIGPRTRLGHARAGSVNWPSGMGHDRASGVMRRLSLSGALSGVRGMPAQQSSPPRAPSPPQAPAQIKSVERPPSPGLRPRSKKSNLTKKRSVSPMGERILKGHFDGFGL